MKKVITYGTFDYLHYGHINLLKNAKQLGDYLIVGITSDDFDMRRGKINVTQSMLERSEAIRATGIADEIIIEEYEGQKIEDIKKYGVDIFAIGSDWVGEFDYINEYCQVVYLPRTEGISSTELRSENDKLSLGLVGDSGFLNKVLEASKDINGLQVVGMCTDNIENFGEEVKRLPLITSKLDLLLDNVDSLYIRVEPSKRYEYIKRALEKGKHVLCESPITLTVNELNKLYDISERNNAILMEALNTAYSTAFQRLLLLIKSGVIGDVVSVDATCTSLRASDKNELNVVFEWGPTGLLPVLEILGTNYDKLNIIAKNAVVMEEKYSFVKFDFLYRNAVASVKIGSGVKSEGELVVSGTKGYLYVPAPWWKTDYFEVRYEDQRMNRRYFYYLDAEGIKSELLSFMKSIKLPKNNNYMENRQRLESIVEIVFRVDRGDALMII